MLSSSSNQAWANCIFHKWKKNNQPLLFSWLDVFLNLTRYFKKLLNQSCKEYIYDKYARVAVETLEVQFRFSQTFLYVLFAW